MSISVNDLERNEIMSRYSPNVKQNDISNCVMLDLVGDELLNHARKVANKLNEKYFQNGGTSIGYTNLFDVLREMLYIQLEHEEVEESYDENEPSLTTVFGKNLEDALKGEN